MFASATLEGSGPSAAAESGADTLADAAEEVRAWLVTARGGAPFLSAADGRLLVGWLESGVPVADLLRAIDETASHRRAKRLRSPFTLRSVERLLVRGAARSSARAQPSCAPPDRIPWPSCAAVEADLATMSPEDVVGRLSRVRRFFDEVWQVLAPVHAVLLADGLVELGEFGDALDDETRSRLCEEFARERVRSHYPSLRPGVLFG
jgi:hypothetical protein